MKEEKEKFPRAAALALVDELMLPDGLNLGASCVRWEVAGSIRRKKAFVGDIEIVLISVQGPPPQLELGMGLPPDLESVMDEKIDALIRKGVLEKRKNTKGHTMCGGRLKQGELEKDIERPDQLSAFLGDPGAKAAHPCIDVSTGKKVELFGSLDAHNWAVRGFAELQNICVKGIGMLRGILREREKVAEVERQPVREPVRSAEIEHER